MVFGLFLRTFERPGAVISYSHPPAKEHVKPVVLLETERALVREVALSTIAKTFSELPDFLNERAGATLVANGTPRVNVAVVLVALLTVTESAGIPENSAEGV